MNQKNVVSDIYALGNAIKINRLIEEKFGNDPEAMERATTAAVDRAKTRGAEFDSIMNGGVVAQLAAFRKAVGEEMWTTIANNPGVNDLLQAWLREQGTKVAMILVEEFKTLLPDNHGMTDQEIFNALGAMRD